MVNNEKGGLSIVMPVYNLESVIAENIQRVARVASAWESCQIIVVDDGSTDLTREEARKAAAPLPEVTVIGYDRNRGKGAALKEGCRYVARDIVVFLDSDLDLPPEQLPSFVAEFRRSGADVLVGAKRDAMTKGSYPLLRKGLSLVFSTVNRVLFRFPISETQTGLKAFRASHLLPAMEKLETTRYAFDLELLTRISKAGGRLTETPVTLAEGSAAGFSLKDVALMGIDTVKIWLRSLRWR